MPFVMVNCGGAQDEPYALSASTNKTDDEILAECQAMTYTVESCVDILNTHNEEVATNKATVSAASLLTDDFVSCQSVEDIASYTDIDCSTTISEMISAYQICGELSSSEKYTGCDDVESVVDDATDSCDQNSSEVTSDFCASLTA